MPGYAKSESGVRKSDFYKKFEFWLGVLAILIAVYAAITARCAANQAEESNRIARETLDWQRRVEEQRKSINITVDGVWSFDNVHVSQWKRSSMWVGGTSNIEVYSGLSFYLQLKVYNGSELPISIDKIDVTYERSGYWSSEFHTNQICGSTIGDTGTYPLRLAPKEQRPVIVCLPWPVSSDMREALDHVPAETIHPAKNIVEAINRWSRIKHRTLYHVSDGDFTSMLDNMFGEFFSPPDSTGTFSLHGVKVRVHLASGHVLTRIFNAMDLTTPLFTSTPKGTFLGK